MTRRITKVIFLVPLLLSGCIPIAYVYPTVDFIPPGKVAEPQDEVRAFRVDVASKIGPHPSHRVSHATLAEVPCSASGRTTGQFQVSLAHGTILKGIPLTYQFGTRRDLELRLYRAGWETVRLDSWQRPDLVEWHPAATLREQERAVDHLLYPGGTSSSALPPSSESDPKVAFDWDGSPTALMPGSASADHKDALLFAAAEYERLAALAGAESAGDQTRMLLKAQRLRNLAGE